MVLLKLRHKIYFASKKVLHQHLSEALIWSFCLKYSFREYMTLKVILFKFEIMLKKKQKPSIAITTIDFSKSSKILENLHGIGVFPN